MFRHRKVPKRFNSFNVHRKVKDLTRKAKSRSATRLVDRNGHVIINKQEILDRWKSYVEELFHDNRPHSPQLDSSTGSSIFKEEVQVAALKEGKATGWGTDGVHQAAG